MKTLTNELRNLLDTSSKFLMADLLTVTLWGGETLRYCSADINTTWDGNLFISFPWERSKIKIVRGMEVDTLILNFSPKIYPVSCKTVEEEDKIMGLPFLKALRLGAWDGATIKIERAFFNPETRTVSAAEVPEPVGVITMFTGRVAPFKYEGTAQITVKSDLEIYNRMLPRNRYQPACLYTLYEADCGLDLNDWEETGTVTATSTTLEINSDLAQADGYFNLGVIGFTSGNLTGERKTIRTYTTGKLILVSPFLEMPAIGDTFKCWPGCDKTIESCQNKFNNTNAFGINYRGFPYIPKPETAI